MPRKINSDSENKDKESNDLSEKEVEKLNRMLAAVLNYITDETVEVIDFEYLLDSTEGLRDWWEKYRERNRKEIETEITKKLSELSIEELEKIREDLKKIKI